MSNIVYLIGDATDPQGGDEMKIIPHIVNCKGAWGAGFVLALSKKWPDVEKGYKQWHINEGKDLPLGQVQFVPAENRIEVANMVGQTLGGKKPIRLSAVKKCMREVFNRARQLNATIHCPRFGCGLTGSNWGEIEPLIQEEWVNKGLTVVVYDFEPTAVVIS